LVLIYYSRTHAAVKLLLIYFSISRALVGGVGGLNQALFRKIIAFSSINHLSWILAARYLRLNTMLNYFFTYSLITSSLLTLFKSKQFSHISQILTSYNLSPIDKIIVFMTILSLGGLPPFLGFSPKLLVITFLITSNNIL